MIVSTASSKDKCFLKLLLFLQVVLIITDLSLSQWQWSSTANTVCCSKSKLLEGRCMIHVLLKNNINSFVPSCVLSSYKVFPRYSKFSHHIHCILTAELCFTCLLLISRVKYQSRLESIIEGFVLVNHRQKTLRWLSCFL